jgi:DNA modification methylase
MDCCLGLKDIPDNQNTVIITDPPYGINLDLKWLSEMNLAKHSPSNKSDCKIINDEKQLDITHLFKYHRRLIFGFPYLYDANATGWIVWDKQPKIAERGIVTPVEVASTTLRKGYDIIRVMWGGYMRDKEGCEERYAHPTQKPLKLMLRIIEKYTSEDDLIVDPYCGTGTTLVASKKLGRNYIGFEIDSEYFKIAEERLKNAFVTDKKFGGYFH